MAAARSPSSISSSRPGGLAAIAATLEGSDGEEQRDAAAAAASRVRGARADAGVPPLRVGLVIGQLSVGGAEGQLRLFCEGCARAGIQPVVYCLSTQTEPYRALIEAAGVPVRVLAGGRLGRTVRLRRALTADRIDLVHSWLFIANAYGWVVSLGRRRPFVTSARNCKRQGTWLDALN